MEQLKLWEEQSTILRMRARKHDWFRQQQERERRKEQKRLRRRTLLRHAMIHSYQERERWYTEQPPLRCEACGYVRPAIDFGGVCNAYGFFPHSRCSSCHEELRECHRFVCHLCQKKTQRGDFLSRFGGYALRGNGILLPLCCKGCETDFFALPTSQQQVLINICCQRTFPVGQVIYAEVDPETEEIRYVGRTGGPTRRHTQHLRDVERATELWVPESRKGNWIQTLSEKGLEPSMQILQSVEASPLVMEWELRFIWHGMQQGWGLLNVQAMDEGLTARVKGSCFDFLQAPFELLVQQGFFSAQGIEAFLRAYAAQ